VLQPVLHGRGPCLNKCETPCSFNNLSPSRYSLEVQKDGYQSVQTALQVKSGDAQDQKIKLESLAKGIFISSQLRVPMSSSTERNSQVRRLYAAARAGQYNLVLRLQGYEPYAEVIQVKDNFRRSSTCRSTKNPQAASPGRR